MDINFGRTKLSVNPTTQADVWQALETNSAFPDRVVKIGDISAQFASGEIPIALGGGANVSLTASFSAGGHSGIGIYAAAADAIASLGLNPSVTPEFPSGPDDRFLLISCDATAQGSVSGKVPIGVLASATFGATAAAATRFAVLYRFAKTAGARTVLEQAGACIKLPREVSTANDLPQGAWIIAEVDGSLALSVGASVGYDFTYERDLPIALQQLGLSKDLSVTVDAAATATVGYNVSGRFLVMLGRPSQVADQVVALQINKGHSYGYTFGLGLSAGVQMSQVLPQNGTDLIAASFGVFGPQVMADVSNSIATLEAWSTGDLGANTAALTITTAKALLKQVTGVDADAAFAEATGKLKDALVKWNSLVAQGSSDVQTLAWDLLGKPANQPLIVKLLTDLRDDDSFDQALSDGLQTLPGQSWLLGIANAIGASSVLSLGSYQADVKQIAGYALDVLSGGAGNIVMKLQTYVMTRFNLTNIIATATDPSKLDQWVQDRLAAFLNKTVLSSGDLKQVQTAINGLLAKFTDIYAKTNAALTKKYNFAFAASYEKVTENTTLLDLSFDLAVPGTTLYQQVLSGDTSAIFRLEAPEPGLAIRNAVMTHAIHTTAKTSLTLPYLYTATTDLNTSVAKLTVSQNGANLVGYVDATDQVLGDRFRSMLTLAMKLGVEGASVTSISASMAYEMRAVARNASKAMVAQATAPFVAAYLAGKLAPNDYSDKLLADFDVAVNLPTCQFGDMLMSMQVAVDGDFISAWVVPLARLHDAQMVASRIVQRCLRDYTHRLYFRNVSAIDSYTTEPLLVWEAFPICTGTNWDPNAGTLSSTNTGQGYYFDQSDDQLIKALINWASASGQLNITVAVAYQEMIAAGGKSGNIVFLPSASAAQYMQAYTFGTGFPFLRSLVLAEYGVVKGVAEALESITAAAEAISLNDPSQLLKFLSQFGATVTQALNKNMSNLFSSSSDLRLFGPMLFVELTKGLASMGSGLQAKAMLELKSLRPQHTFDLSTYVTGSEPTPDQTAVAQTIVSV